MNSRAHEGKEWGALHDKAAFYVPILEPYYGIPHYRATCMLNRGGANSVDLSSLCYGHPYLDLSTHTALKAQASSVMKFLSWQECKVSTFLSHHLPYWWHKKVWVGAIWRSEKCGLRFTAGLRLRQRRESLLESRTLSWKQLFILRCVHINLCILKLNSPLAFAFICTQTPSGSLDQWISIFSCTAGNWDATGLYYSSCLAGLQMKTRTGTAIIALSFGKVTHLSSSNSIIKLGRNGSEVSRISAQGRKEQLNSVLYLHQEN